MARDQSVSDGVTPAPGFVVWLTGLPASGKSTLARLGQQKLAQSRTTALVLDSDELRDVLTPNPAYSEEERDWFYGVIVYWAAWLARNGINVLVAATAHRRAYRQDARLQIARFIEVYVQCSLEACRRRDTKGIYALADAGKAPNVPGVGSRYEPPDQPEIAVDTEQLTPQAATENILNYLAEHSFVHG